MVRHFLAPALLLFGAIFPLVRAGGPELNSNDRFAANFPSFDLSIPLLTANPDESILFSGPWTNVHAPGICAVRGRCGKSGFFGPELPCVDNTRAAPVGTPKGVSTAGRDRLIKLCGEEWRDVVDSQGTCCDDGQIDALASNFQRVDQIIGSCPACQKNFFSLFCSFTCSPDQSLFVNVTDAELLKGQTAESVKSLSVAVSEEFSESFYKSCEDVKFGSGMRAIDLIGGGAKNHRDLLAFLGRKRLGGSPFEMEFVETAEEPMVLLDIAGKQCDGDEEAFKCSCADCKRACPTLPPVSQSECRVGVLPCLTFTVIIVYSVIMLVIITLLALSGKRQNRGAPLLQDVLDDDDDEPSYAQDGGYVFNYQTRSSQDDNAMNEEYPLNTILERFFTRLGLFCADFPATTIGVALLLGLVCSMGWFWVKLETDPVKLWVSPDSEAALEREYFDAHMGPQIRAQQLIAVNQTGPVLSHANLEWWIGVEERVGRLIGMFSEGGITYGVGWEDICLKPAGGCVVQSVGGYFQHQPLNNWERRVRDCTAVPVDCLVNGMPVDSNLVLGHSGSNLDYDILDSEAMILTWVVDGNKRAIEVDAWEDVLLHVLRGVEAEGHDRGLNVSFSTGQSLEEELERTAGSDGRVVVASYVVMLLYVIVMLSANAFWTDSVALAVLHSKVGVGIAGIAVVILSVAAAGGIVVALGFPVTLIIAEVIPFLVLAVGVDNVFLLVHAVDRANEHNRESHVSQRISDAVARTGPSIVLAASAEIGLFALGAAVGMPAVRNFAIYAAIAVLVNALLQLTLFVAVLAIDLRRVEDKRADCIPFVRVEIPIALPGQEREERERLVTRFVREIYAPGVVSARYLILAIAGTSLALCLGLLVPKVQLGLDQRLALPTDSYLVNYFDDIAKYLQVGPPVFFVVQDIDATERGGQAALCGRVAGCQGESVPTILGLETDRSSVSLLTGGVAGWEDDFLRWLDPAVDCCTDKRGKPCWPEYNRQLNGMPQGEEFVQLLNKWLDMIPGEDCPLGGAAYSDAIVFETKQAKVTVSSEDASLESNSNTTIITASHFRTAHTPLRTQADFIAAYESARRIAADLSSRTGTKVFPYSEFYVFFHQYLTIIPLATKLLLSAAAVIFVLLTIFTGSFATAGVVTGVVASIVIHVIAAMAVFGISLNAVSLVNLLICAGLAVEFCAHVARSFSIPDAEVISLVPYDAPALRNGRLGTAINSAISRSLSLHRSFGLGRSPAEGRAMRSSLGAAGVLGNQGGSGGRIFASRTPFSGQAAKPGRAMAALMDVGPAVVEGIGLTKVLGVSVLAFAQSKIFDVYYFRVWAVLVVVALVHSLAVLPAALAVWGGRAWRGGAGSSDLRTEFENRTYHDDVEDDTSILL